MSNKSVGRQIIAVGDVHGEYETFLAILYDAKLIDLAGNWAAGDTILVQTGDMIDRGSKSIESVEFIRSLQEKAGRCLFR